MPAAHLTKLRTALSVAGLVVSLVVGYNTWPQIEAVNAGVVPHASNRGQAGDAS